MVSVRTSAAPGESEPAFHALAYLEEAVDRLVLQPLPCVSLVSTGAFDELLR